MSIERLLQLLPPPEKASRTSGDWLSVSRQLEVGELPKDYKQFMDRYGAGNFCDFIHIWNPHTEEKFGLIEQAKIHETALRGLKHVQIPYPIFPEPGGLLAWGRTDNSDILMWLTRGEPDAWPVVVTDNSDFYDMGMSMTAFLAGLLDKSVRCPAFPDDVPSVKKYFPG